MTMYNCTTYQALHSWWATIVLIVVEYIFSGVGLVSSVVLVWCVMKTFFSVC